MAVTGVLQTHTKVATSFPQQKMQQSQSHVVKIANAVLERNRHFRDRSQSYKDQNLLDQEMIHREFACKFDIFMVMAERIKSCAEHPIGNAHLDTDIQRINQNFSEQIKQLNICIQTAINELLPRNELVSQYIYACERFNETLTDLCHQLLVCYTVIEKINNSLETDNISTQGEDNCIHTMQEFKRMLNYFLQKCQALVESICRTDWHKSFTVSDEYLLNFLEDVQGILRLHFCLIQDLYKIELDSINLQKQFQGIYDFSSKELETIYNYDLYAKLIKLCMQGYQEKQIACVNYRLDSINNIYKKINCLKKVVERRVGVLSDFYVKSEN